MQPWLFLIICLAWHAVGLPTPDEINTEALEKFADSMRKSQPGVHQWHAPEDSTDDAPDDTPDDGHGDTPDDTPDNLSNGNDIDSNPVNSTLDTETKNDNGFISAAYFVNWVRPQSLSILSIL